MAKLDSIDILVKRRTDMIRLDKERVEVTKRYTKLLQDFGFDNIYVKPGAWYVSNGIQYFDVNKLNLFFWDKTFGYQLEIIRGGRMDWNKTNKCISTGEFILICDKMIEFLSNPTTLRGCNITEQLVLHLESNKYTIVNVLKFSDKNSSWMQIGKDGFFFTLRINRIDLTQDVLYYFLIKWFNYPISTCDTGNDFIIQRTDGIAQTVNHFF